MNTPDVPLREVSERTRVVTALWSPHLNFQDKITLYEAFEMAETFALFALECAVEQVADRYRNELQEQIEDERRHIMVFSEWRGLELREINRIRRTREDYVWFTLLLVNELTGYCQFQMLSSLVETEAQRDEVDRICKDEEKHIDRLIRWLFPVKGSSRAVVPREIVLRFERELPQRMQQFMPREELAPLRGAIAAQVSILLRWVLDEVLAPH